VYSQCAIIMSREEKISKSFSRDKRCVCHKTRRAVKFTILRKSQHNIVYNIIYLYGIDMCVHIFYISLNNKVFKRFNMFFFINYVTSMVLLLLFFFFIIILREKPFYYYVVFITNYIRRGHYKITKRLLPLLLRETKPWKDRALQDVRFELFVIVLRTYYVTRFEQCTIDITTKYEHHRFIIVGVTDASFRDPSGSFSWSGRDVQIV
jgi:hypothetical protein